MHVTLIFYLWSDNPVLYRTRMSEKSLSFKGIELQTWYHGLLTPADVRDFLLDVGQFLVRAAINSKQEPELYLDVKILPVMIPEAIWSGKIGKSEQGYHIEPNVYFKSVKELVQNYTKSALPCRLRLKTGVSRPSWLLHHNQLKYKEKDKLGGGNFSNVYKGSLYSHFKKKKFRVAVKVNRCDESDFATIVANMTSEAKLMTRYRNPHVIKFYGLACDRQPLMLITELCYGGSLEKFVSKYGLTVSNVEKHVFLLEISRGMRYLHSQRCIHRDLAARNCLIAVDGRVRIADFGLSKFLQKQEDQLHEVLSTFAIRWMAPECLNKSPMFSVKSDVWSFAVVIFELFTNGDKPYRDNDDSSLIRNYRNCVVPPFECPSYILKIYKEIWVKNPIDRPSFDQLHQELRGTLPDIKMSDLNLFVVNTLKHVKKNKLPQVDEIEQMLSDGEASPRVSISSIPDVVALSTRPPARKANSSPNLSPIQWSSSLHSKLGKETPAVPPRKLSSVSTRRSNSAMRKGNSGKRSPLPQSPGGVIKVKTSGTTGVSRDYVAKD